MLSPAIHILLSYWGIQLQLMHSIFFSVTILPRLTDSPLGTSEALHMALYKYDYYYCCYYYYK